MPSSLNLRQLSGVPSTADGLDEEDARVHAPPLDVDIVALVRQENRLRGDDLQVVVDTSLVSIRKELQRFLSRRGRLLLVPRLALQDTQCSKIVFYFLEGGKGRL